MATRLQNTANGQILFADHATDFGAGPNTAANSLILGTPTDVQIDLTSVAASSGRQSAKFDFGTPRPPLYRMDACIEHASAVGDGEIVDFWIAGSPVTGATIGNPAGLTGSDAAFTTTRGLEGQMIKVGSLQLRANVINIGFVGIYRPTHQFGILVFVNNAGTIAMHTAMDEVHITLTPIDYSDV